MSEQETLLLKEPIANITCLQMLQLLNKEDAAAKERRKAEPKPDLPIFPKRIRKPRRQELSFFTGAVYNNPQDETEIKQQEALEVLRQLQTTPVPTPAPDIPPAPAHACNKHRLLGLFNWAVKTLWPDTQG